MPRVISAFKQFLDGNGDPLVSGWLKFLVSGTTSTDKDTYADVDETIANSNPVQLDAEGRCPNIFGTGTYRVISYTNDPVLGSPDVQIQQFDPVGASLTTGEFSNWDSTATYNIPQIVTGDDLNFYRSLTNLNTDNDPILDAENWERIEFEQIYNENKTYSEFERCIDSAGISYISLAGSNLANTPSTSPTYWGLKIGSALNSNGNQIQESRGVDIPAAAALPLTLDGNYFDITGTAGTAITSITTSGRIGTSIKARAASSGIVLTHSASDLILPNAGDNITTEIGDTLDLTEYASGDWICTNYQRAADKQFVPSGVIQIVSLNMPAVATGSTVFPQDDTIPQITEGNAFMSLPITPTSATNRLRIEAVFFGADSGGVAITVALFQDTIANALSATESGIAANVPVTIPLSYDMVAGTTSATTFIIRAAGPGGITTFNGASATRRYGGVAGSSMIITEYVP